MFKVYFSRDTFNDDPEKRNRITGIHITHGYQCGDACYCNCSYKCKYRKGFKFHNWSVSVHRFFEYYLHIKLPHFLYINKLWTNLSGTTKCPYHKSRLYSCWDCKYCSGGLDSVCLNEKRNSAGFEERKFVDPEWGPHHRCSFFEKHERADCWDKDTGEKIFD